MKEIEGIGLKVDIQFGAWTVKILNPLIVFDNGFETRPDETKFIWEARWSLITIKTEQRFNSRYDALKNCEDVIGVSTKTENLEKN